ncbi:MAG: DNA-binding response regulator [Deltaproteobacteria bacterium]|nr:MAG: DNA-binding response regulator [Deltaproteobacteria bacterium]
MVKVLIVDDHPIFRMGMSELINQEEDFTVCAAAEDIASARKAMRETGPDMAVIDISLAGDNGLDLVKEIAAGQETFPMLVLSMHDEAVWAERAIRAGARGYIMKKEASESIISAMKDVLAGKVRVSEAVTSHLLDKFRPHSGSAGTAGSSRTIDLLTDRELEVFRLIGSGLKTREIAERMKLGVKTIGTYRDRIKQKLNIKTGAELTRRAVLWTEKEGSAASCR